MHRLIQNKADGKLVELPSASSTAGAATERSEGPTDLRSGMSESAQSEKIEAIGLEYSYLLTSQLESQRYYYEDKVRGLQAKFEDISTRFDEARSRADEAERRSSAWERRVGELEKEVVPALEKERAKAEKRAEKAVELARRFERDLETERSVSRGLMANMDKMREGGQKSEKELANVKSEVADLREQVSPSPLLSSPLVTR